MVLEALGKNNMKKITLKNIILLFSTIFLLSACGKKEEKINKLSIDKSKLIIRLFDSLEKEDYSTALIQAQKLQSFDNKNIYLFNAIEICTTNVTINKINNLIKEKKIQEAYTLLKRLNETYPLNEKIQKDLIEMEKILKE